MARDRMTQLELFRRTANGRLAEVFGAVSSKFIESDVTMRTIGLRRMAEQQWAVTGEGRMHDMFEGYSAGVNHYLSSCAADSCVRRAALSCCSARGLPRGRRSTRSRCCG